MKVAIIGGGISGVTAARLLKDKGVAVDILERERVAGGLMRSQVVNGYTFDTSGGHVMFSRNEWYYTFVKGLFAEGELVASTRNTKILHNGRFVHYPFENGISDLDPEDRMPCVKGYIEAWARRQNGATVPDNFYDWVHYRFGDGICKAFMVPYNEKIWKSDLHDVGIDWVEDRVPIAPLEDILRSAMGQRTEGYTHQITFYYPLHGGFQAIFDRIAESVQDDLHTEVEVERIEKKGNRYDVDGTLYDKVISTIPLPNLTDVLVGWESASREAARALQYRGVTSFLFGTSAESVPPISWLYLPHPHQGPANRITLMSNYSPRNAPEGRGSVQAEVTHAGPLAVDTDYLERLCDHFARLNLLDRDQVDLMHYHGNKWGYILFDRDFTAKRRLAIDGVERLGVYPLGRFGRFNYHNSDHCVVAAKAMVERILAEEGGS